MGKSELGSFFTKNLDKIEWDNISRNRNVPLSFFENHIDKFPIIYLFDNRGNSSFNLKKLNTIIEFVEKYPEKIDWGRLASCDIFPVSFFEKHRGKIPLYWSALCLKNIPVSFFEKNLNEIDQNRCWDYLCKNQNIPVSFFEKNLDKIDQNRCWGYLCKNQNIPVEFFEKHLDKLNKYCWENLCRNKTLPAEFFEKHLNNLNECCWSILCGNETLPVEFFEKYLDKINGKRHVECWSALCRNKNIPVKFFEKNLDKLDVHCWEYLCKNNNIPIEFLEKHLDKLNQNYLNTNIRCNCWYFLFTKRNITVEFFEKYSVEVKYFCPLSYFCKNKNIPFEYLEKNLDKLCEDCWSMLCRNNNIPIGFFEKHLDKVDWYPLSKNDFNNYFMNKKNKKRFHEKYILVLDDIKLLGYVPKGKNKILPEGGYDYREMMNNYEK